MELQRDENVTGSAHSYGIPLAGCRIVRAALVIWGFLLICNVATILLH
jgi:hypothetical protein